MADNTQVLDPTAIPGGGGDIIATDELPSGAKAQRIKIMLGEDGADGGNVTPSNPLPVVGSVTTGGLTNTELRATPVPVSGPLTDAQLRASAVPVSSSALTDAQLRAFAVPVSGPLTDVQLRATRVPVNVDINQPLTDTELRASAVPVSGPLTDTQLRATPAPVSMAQVADTGNSTTITNTGAMFTGAWFQTRSVGFVRQLTVLASTVASGLGGTFTFQYSKDGVTPTISEVRTLSDFATVRDFDLINAGEWYRVIFTPSRVLTASEFVFIATTQRRQNDGAFVRLANQEIEEANAAMPQTFAYAKAFGLNGKSVNLRGSSESVSNNSEANLAGAAVFTGVAEDVTQFKNITVFVASDQSGTLTIEFAKNTADFADMALVTGVARAYAAGSGQGYVFVPISKFYRIKYTNGATPQTKFRLQTIVHHTAEGPIFSPVDSPVTSRSLAQGVRAVVVAKRPDGTFGNVESDAAGGLFVTAAKVLTYRACARSAVMPFTLQIALTAITAVQVVAIWHLASSTRTARLRRVDFRLGAITSAGGGNVSFDLVRITSAPTGGAVVTPDSAESSQVAAESIVQSLPAVAGTTSTFLASHSLELASADKNFAVTLYEMISLIPDRAPTMRAGVLEGFAIVARADAVVTLQGTAHFTWSEES